MMKQEIFRFDFRFKNQDVFCIISKYSLAYKLIQSCPKWQNKNVYLLLLMPIVGKELIPKNIQHFMDNDSPIKDLFPEPCPECIKFKTDIRQLLSDIDKYDEIEYKKLSSELNTKYRNHLENNHKIDDLPIERIESVFNYFTS